MTLVTSTAYTEPQEPLYSVDSYVSHLIKQSLESQSLFRKIKSTLLNRPQVLPKPTFGAIVACLPELVNDSIFDFLSLQRLLLISKSSNPNIQITARKAIIKIINTRLCVTFINLQNYEAILPTLYKTFKIFQLQLSNNYNFQSILPVSPTSSFDEFLTDLGQISCKMLLIINHCISGLVPEDEISVTLLFLKLLVKKLKSNQPNNLSANTLNASTLQHHIILLFLSAIRSKNIELIKTILKLPVNVLDLPLISIFNKAIQHNFPECITIILRSYRDKHPSNDIKQALFTILYNLILDNYLNEEAPFNQVLTAIPVEMLDTDLAIKQLTELLQGIENGTQPYLVNPITQIKKLNEAITAIEKRFLPNSN